VVTLLVFCSTAVLCACGGSDGERLPVHPARGTVLYKGKPLADALVVLRPVNASAKQGGPPQSIGRTNSEGKFVLHTYVGDDGAPEGSYLVGISVSQAFSENRDLFENAKKKQVSRPAPDPLGTRYSDPATSGLKAEIKPGENEIPPFELS
jgi:hypothetical protein